MKNQPDFMAELKYLTFYQGGRRTPAISGYRPIIKFDFSDKLTSGQQTFIGRELVNPGETVLAEIAIISIEFFYRKLKDGF